MRLILARPSFWSEPRAPQSWLQALEILAKLPYIPDPWPCWEKYLRPTLSRRAVPGLYGIRWQPLPPTLWGAGLIEWRSRNWQLSPIAQTLLSTTPSQQIQVLAHLLVQRSPWLRLLLWQLHTGKWHWRRSPKDRYRLEIQRDLELPKYPWRSLPSPSILLGEQAHPKITTLKISISPTALAPLIAPLYLLQALGWLTDDGYPHLPDDLLIHLGQASPAVLLRQITQSQADRSGFVPLEKVALTLWQQLYPEKLPQQFDTWLDRTFGDAIAQGSIEIEAWASGQPRHGRGLYGDRTQKLVRWKIHDNFTLPTLDERIL